MTNLLPIKMLKTMAFNIQMGDIQKMAMRMDTYYLSCSPMIAIVIFVGDGMKLQRKAMIKRGITRSKAKPGRGRPAKNYDPVKKEWRKG